MIMIRQILKESHMRDQQGWLEGAGTTVNFQVFNKDVPLGIQHLGESVSICICVLSASKGK